MNLPNGKSLVHMLKPKERFNLQFGRLVVAYVLGAPEVHVEDHQKDFHKSVSEDWDLADLPKRIRERDCPNHLANTSVNKPNADRLYLELIPHDLFKLPFIEEDASMEDVVSTNDEQLELRDAHQLVFKVGASSPTEETPPTASLVRLT
ncbi:hypothetical protein PS15p_208604 [Mucor circinelloides]